jgi:AraC family transcriptional regulator of adaptative response/methylated-DNA-[protein]-cysteine methyltransferase
MPAPNPAEDYARIADAIAWLVAHGRQQPDLAALARHLGLSDTHLQRLFTRWAGISPKRFLQSLTLDFARSRLLDVPDLLSLSLDAGLSGPGRLHDLFVTVEAVSPGEAKSGGAGVTLRWGVHPTPFGAALVAASGRGVCKLHFVAPDEAPVELLAREWPRAMLVQDPAATASTAAALFQRGTPRAPVALWVKGSNFQLQVWRALLAIPPGRLASYSSLAAGLGRPRAARAVGNAIAANPLAVLIPCHRVIRESGAVSAYRWGETRKRALQAWECADTQAARDKRVRISDAHSSGVSGVLKR